MGTGIIGVVLTLGAISGSRDNSNYKYVLIEPCDHKDAEGKSLFDENNTCFACANMGRIVKSEYDITLVTGQYGTAVIKKNGEELAGDQMKAKKGDLISITACPFGARTPVVKIYIAGSTKPAIVPKDSDYNLVENAFVYEYRMLARDITIKVDFEPAGDMPDYPNTMIVKAKKPKVKASRVAKKKQKIKTSIAFTIQYPQGIVSFKKKAGSKRLSISNKGIITVAKGTKKGTYKIKVKVTASGDGIFRQGSRTVTVKVIVK